MTRTAWLLVVFGGCATTSVAPTVVRFEPFNPSTNRSELAMGIRTGPRLPVALGARSVGSWAGADDSLDPTKLGLAYDLSVTLPTTSPLAFHLSAQAEFAFPLPFPGIGVGAGASYLLRTGRFSFAPAVGLRGATDFGIGSITSGQGATSATVVGIDLSATFSVRASDEAKVGLVPFVSVQKPLTFDDRYPAVWYAGGMMAMRFARVEVMAGFGRVFDRSGGFNVPLLAVRLGVE